MQHLCFFNSTSFWGGGEKLFLDYALLFKALGYKVTLACDENGPLATKAKDNDLKTLPVKVKNLSFLNPLLHSLFKSLSLSCLPVPELSRV